MVIHCCEGAGGRDVGTNALAPGLKVGAAAFIPTPNEVCRTGAGEGWDGGCLGCLFCLAFGCCPCPCGCERVCGRASGAGCRDPCVNCVPEAFIGVLPFFPPTPPFSSTFSPCPCTTPSAAALPLPLPRPRSGGTRRSCPFPLPLPLPLAAPSVSLRLPFAPAPADPAVPLSLLTLACSSSHHRINSASSAFSACAFRSSA